jgi:predicted SAM-dependent methyltransferase
VGSGRVALPGWTNVDLEALPGVDFVLDVRNGLPFEGVELLYAEHFIEHLTHDEGLRFLAEARKALSPDGILRLSTPNLDWVISTQYRLPSADAITDCFAINKAFRGWGHQFLYNEQTLRAALHDAGFAEIVTCSYGTSSHEELRGLEHHETYPDTPELPHVIILEARGRAARRASLEKVSEDYDWAVNP